MRQLLAVSCLIALSSCAPKSTPTKVSVIDGSIVNGKTVSATDALSQSVVGVYNTKYKSICTGSLIAPNIVMTAAHCIPEKPAHLKIVFSTDVDNVINSREPDVIEELSLSASDFKVGPTWDPKNETVEVDTGDIALIKFKGVTPAGYKSAVFLQDASLLKIGNMVTVAGFGVDTVEFSKKIDPKKYKNFEEALEYGEVICDDQINGKYTNCYEVEMTGDGILRTTEAPISFIHETEVKLNERKSGTCNGDSGGPAYIRTSEGLFLFGVTSRGSGLCNDAGVYTNALFYKNWIDSTIPTLQ